MRVLLVGKGAPERGGIPSFLDTLLHDPELRRSCELTFLNLAHAGRPQGGRPTVANIARTVRDTAAVWRSSRGQDIVHIHSALAPAVTVIRAGLLAAAARARGCRVIMHAHGGNMDAWLSRPGRARLMRLAMRPVARIVAVWTAGLQALGPVLGEERVSLIDNGVDLSRFRVSPTQHDPPRVLYVGLLTARKGVIDLLDASARLRDRGVPHELSLLGGTPDEGPEAAVPVHRAAAGRATLVGTLPPSEMPHAYGEADVFCLPSWWEAAPLSVLEAMASGLPVVATDVGDLPRMLADGAGSVVPRQSPEHLALALEELLTDPQLRASAGGRARARVEECFSSTGTARRVLALYGELGGTP